MSYTRGDCGFTMGIYILCQPRQHTSPHPARLYFCYERKKQLAKMYSVGSTGFVFARAKKIMKEIVARFITNMKRLFGHVLNAAQTHCFRQPRRRANRARGWRLERDLSTLSQARNLSTPKLTTRAEGAASSAGRAATAVLRARMAAS